MTSAYIKKLDPTDSLEGLDELATAIKPPEPCLRSAEINNIQTGLRGQIWSLEEWAHEPDLINETVSIVAEYKDRLEALVENPESAGKHDEILRAMEEEKIPDTLRAADFPSDNN